MKKVIVIALFTLILCGLMAQNISCINPSDKSMSDTLKITTEDFRLKVETFTKKMVNPDDNLFSQEDLVTIVRIYNTLTFNFQLRKEYSDFYKLFSSAMLSKCVIGLDMSVWRDGSYYSKKYNLFIGGKQDSNSQYYVVGK